MHRWTQFLRKYYFTPGVTALIFYLPREFADRGCSVSFIPPHEWWGFQQRLIYSASWGVGLPTEAHFFSLMRVGYQQRLIYSASWGVGLPIAAHLFRFMRGGVKNRGSFIPPHERWGYQHRLTYSASWGVGLPRFRYRPKDMPAPKWNRNCPAHDDTCRTLMHYFSLF